MISKDREYKIFNPKEYADKKGNKYYRFSISDSKKNLQTNEWESLGFCNVMAYTEDVLFDRDKVKITEISGVEKNVYNDKVQLNIIAKIEKVSDDFIELGDDEPLPF